MINIAITTTENDPFAQNGPTEQSRLVVHISRGISRRFRGNPPVNSTAAHPNSPGNEFTAKKDFPANSPGVSREMIAVETPGECPGKCGRCAQGPRGIYRVISRMGSHISRWTPWAPCPWKSISREIHASVNSPRNVRNPPGNLDGRPNFLDWVPAG